MTAAFEVASVEDTWAVARDFARRLKSGDVVCLEGDLGAGKTTFTQGLCAALGAGGRVTSPTFCIVREHPLAHPGPAEPPLVVHMDLYRLSGEDDVVDIGWDEYLSRKAIIVVEWPERAGSLIPTGAWHVSFKLAPDSGDEARTISICRNEQQ